MTPLAKFLVPPKNNQTSNFTQIASFFFSPYKWKMLFLASLMFLASSLETLNLMVLYPLINYGLEQKSKGQILEFFDQLVVFSQTDNLFLFYCTVLIFTTVLAVSVKFYTQFVSFNLFREISRSFYNTIFEKYLAVDYNFFIKNQQGDLIHTGTVASGSVSTLVYQSIQSMSDVFRFLLLLSSLVFISWQGTLLIIAVGIVYYMLIKTVMRKITYPYGQKSAIATRKKNVLFNELLSGIKTIRIYLGSHLWRQKYEDAVVEETNSHFKMMMGRVIPESLMFLMLFMVIAVSGISIDQMSQGNILPLIPLFATFGLIATRIIPSAQTLGNGIMTIVASLPNTQYVYDLLNNNPETTLEGSKELEVFEKEISFNQVYFSFPGVDSSLFEKLSFKIEKGKTTAIVGSSGNGKSTLINLLFRLYTLDQGNITIDGVDVTEYTRDSYLSKIGYVSQETFIYNTTIKENIRFALEDCSDERVIEAAKQANAHEFITETHKGYETMVGDSGVKLSGGQRQRIAIARAILKRPEIMVLDEATSSLDNISEKKVQEAIDQLSEHTTVVIIAHRLSTIINADKILVLSKGKVVEEGRHEELLNTGGEYSKLYNLQFQGGDV